MTNIFDNIFRTSLKNPNRLSWLPILRSPQKTGNEKRERDETRKRKIWRVFRWSFSSVRRVARSLLEVDMSKREKCLTNKQLRGPPNCLQLLFWLLPPDVAEPSFMMSLGAFDLFLCTFFAHKLVDTHRHNVYLYKYIFFVITSFSPHC